MSGSPIALAIVAAIVFGTIAFALLAVRRIKMDPAQYIVGGRSFGTILDVYKRQPLPASPQ